MGYKKKTWDELSEKERKQYINQDFVPQRELLAKGIENHTFVSPWYGSLKTNHRIIYEMYFLDGKSVSDIIYHIEFSKMHIYRVIEQMKELIEDFCSTQVQKEILYKHFKDGKEQQIIADEIGVGFQYVYRIVDSYLKYCEQDKREKQ